MYIVNLKRNIRHVMLLDIVQDNYSDSARSSKNSSIRFSRFLYHIAAIT